MANNENRITQQVKDKITSYNRQRGGSAVVFVIFVGIFIFSPAAGTDTLPVRLSLFCSAVLILCSATFVLSFRASLASLLVSAGIPATLLVLSQIHVELFLILLLINAGTVCISGIIGKSLIRSFTNEIEERNRLEAKATTDSLTRLLNRNGLEQAAAASWAFCKRDRKNIGVILADIDYFKSYNDILGHPEGDNILKQVADSIKCCFRRETDIIGRIGGDEFLIVLSDLSDSHVLEMAQSLSSTIINLKVKTTSENTPCDYLSVSIGVATSMPQPGDLLTDLYKTVDEALYRAKKSGRNCISFHDMILQIGTSMEESFPTSV